MILRTWSITDLNDFFHLVAPSCSVKMLPSHRFGSKSHVLNTTAYANWLSSGKKFGGRRGEEAIGHCFKTIGYSFYCFFFWFWKFKGTTRSFAGVGGQKSFQRGWTVSRIRYFNLCLILKSVQSALSDLLTTSATHGTFPRPSTKRGLISIIKLM